MRFIDVIPLEKVGFPAMDHEMIGETFKLPWMARLRLSHDPKESEESDFEISSTQLETHLWTLGFWMGHMIHEFVIFPVCFHLPIGPIKPSPWNDGFSPSPRGWSVTHILRGSGGLGISKTNTGSKAFNPNFQQDRARHHEVPQLYVGL